nr:unnamed protein product [Meloidogyne enterolobii]
MHYAAAARDGGHYLKILGKAGADPMAVDNGRTPDYYRRNAVFDLKLLKERDVEELGADALLSKSVQHGDFPDSPSESADLLSLHSSGVDTGRKGLEKGGGREYIDDEGEMIEFDGNGDGDGIDDREDAEKNRFEHLLHERLGMPTSDNGLYLARTVAPVLTKALAEVLLRRPANPIGFISDWLVKYTEETEQF